MTLSSLGDLSASLMFRRLSSDLKGSLNRLGTELVTGRRSDVSAVVAGDFGPLAGIERSLKSLAAYRTASLEAEGLLSGAQLALDTVQATGREVSSALLTAASARDATLIRATAQTARAGLDTVISNLNTRLADRSLFAGAATDGPALASADLFLSEITAAIAGETTAAGIVAAVNDWFTAPGGGFETLGYLGADQPIGAVMIAEDEAVGLTTKADATALRDTLKGFALSSLVAEGVLSGDPEQQAELLSASAQSLMLADGDLTTMRASIGTLEERIETTQARSAAEKTALELARNELIGVDPYEATTELQAVYAQLEMLYTVTTRISALKFTDFMR